MKTVLFALALFTLTFSTQAQLLKKREIVVEASNILTPEDFEMKMKKSQGKTIIDMRPAKDFKISHLDAAINIPYDSTFLSQTETLDKNKAVFIYAGKKTDQKLMMNPSILSLLKAGFKEVYFLEGGFELWNKKHKPVFINAPENDSSGF